MGDMYSNNNDHNLLPYSSTSSLSSSSPPQDEISLFLRQILLRSSSTSAQNTSLTGLSPSFENAHTSHRSSLFQDAISAVDSSVGVRASNNVFLSSLGGSSVNIPSSSFGVSENEFDEYDCESEEGIEALVEQHQVKSVPSRSSSKRSRAAEVHNMSEKRRRNRINEKMKALQNLIPNSNKTDKASMLDEAIEYLKQLQLQVQMLSIRNGLSVHPMCFSEDLQPQQLCQMRSELNEEIRSLPSNMTTTTMPLTQQNPLQYDSKSTLPDKLNTQDQPLMPSPSYTINPRTSFSLQSSTLQPIRSFPLNITSEICSNEILQQKQLKASLSDTIPLGGFQVSQGFETGIVGKDQQASALRNHFNITSHFRLSNIWNI